MLLQLPVLEPSEAALTFSGSQFLVSLIAGLIMAFAFQLLLTNFGVAAGITALGFLSPSKASSTTETAEIVEDLEDADSSLPNIGFWLGFSTLLTVNTVLFFACFLAVKLSLVSSASVGAILAIVIWSSYFLILIWVSSTVIGSFIGAVVNTAISGFQGLVNTASNAFAKPVEPKATEQLPLSQVETVAALSQGFSDALSNSGLQETLQTYLQRLQPPQLDLPAMRNEIKELLQAELEPVRESRLASKFASNLERQALLDLIKSRPDFSQQEADQLADELKAAWQQVSQDPPDPQTELLDLLQSADPKSLDAQSLQQRLHAAGKQLSSFASQNLTQNLDFKALLRTVLQRVDLSDLDVEKILPQVQAFLGSNPNEVAEKSAQPFSTIRADIENYLLNAYPWALRRKTVKTEFKDVLYDPEAAPEAIQKQLEKLDRSYFVQVLQQRQDLTPDKLEKVANRLEEVRLDVLDKVQVAQTQEQAQDLQNRLGHYLRSLKKSKFGTKSFQRELKSLLSSEANFSGLRQRLSPLDRHSLRHLLKERTDLSQAELTKLLNQLESLRDQVLAEASDQQERAQTEAEAQWQKLESYLRDTSKKLSVKGLKRELQALFKGAQSNLHDATVHFDREGLAQLLNERKDLTTDQIDAALHQIEAVWHSRFKSPRKAVAKAKARQEQVSKALSQYLQTTSPDAFDPDALQQNLAQLVEDPKIGALALRQGLAQLDWANLLQVLRGRQDLSEAQIEQLIEGTKAVIPRLSKTPRRFALRAQTQLQDWQTQFEDYLRHTEKEELNPEAIKHDLQLLLDEPQAGLEQISQRLSKFDRSTLVALLSQREDLTEAEAQQIIEQLETVRDQWLDRVQAVQTKIQSVTESSLSRIQDYLKSLNRPELDYDQIQQEVRQLLGDPQAGWDALKLRLSQFDRGTLAAFLSSRQDISEAAITKVLDQVETVRGGLLQQADALQQAAQAQLARLQRQAQRQAEATRKAAATAAWWLFGTALTSLATSAIAGISGVLGLSVWWQWLSRWV
ncbi:MFS transporter [Leptolyngbya sp. FACHB-261]|uniref:MFS transporter n=1 Tax=Leptolyngbya sp. FACHB-261 TaxID=2692806 RepID=UPI0016833077|nr:MFS transporter [Leptolyngbya sp. FACHB-261]MBD2102781.1 MFS transporter [Leptolyngbya sp. FACHB-261]